LLFIMLQLVTKTIEIVDAQQNLSEKTLILLSL
jgi:hypothetical protein